MLSLSIVCQRQRWRTHFAIAVSDVRHLMRTWLNPVVLPFPFPCSPNMLTFRGGLMALGLGYAHNRNNESTGGAR